MNNNITRRIAKCCLLSLLLISACTKTKKYSPSITSVYKTQEAVVAMDKWGGIIKKGQAGVDDATVIQAALEAISPAGELRISAGKYILSQPIKIEANLKIVGEGRGTVLVPPSNDYAIRIEKNTSNMIPRPYHKVENDPLYAIIIRDLTIDGETDASTHSGKGIRITRIWSSSFENLWIQNVDHALSLNTIHESDFSNIYLMNTGNEEEKTPGIYMYHADNIHFDGLYVIYQNYIGLDIHKSKLIFASNSMFHGWLPRLGGPGKYPLIRLRDLNNNRNPEDRLKGDFVLENTRITVGGGQESIQIDNSPFTLSQCVATSGFAHTLIKATGNSRINVSNNSFYSLKDKPAGTYVVDAEDSEVYFKNNTLGGKNLSLKLSGIRNSIISDNRFDVEVTGPSILLDKSPLSISKSVQVKGNFFKSNTLKEAIQQLPGSGKNISIQNNMLLTE